MTTRPVNTASTSDLTEVFYPETDGMPLADGYFQDPLFREILSIFELYYLDSPSTAVSGNTFVYYEEGNSQRWVSPDCYIALDISMESIERFNTYRIWEVGKPPDFVLEIGSPSTATTDLGRKRELYAELGIGEYWRFDSTGGDFYREPLVGERLVEGEYRRLELEREPGGRVRGHSEVLGLDICWEDGHLRVYDPAADKWLPNYWDVYAWADAEQAARESAETLVDTERTARESAETLADEERAARESAEARAHEERSARESAEARAYEERSARESAEARLAEMEAELRRLRGE